jgi:hypothetical protein
MDRRKRMTARISLLALTLLGCNNSAATAVEDVPAEQAAALCDLFLRCGVATDEALCAGNLWSTFIITGEFLPNIASVRAAIERGSVIYHEEHLEACLVDIRETACTRKDFWQIASDALARPAIRYSRARWPRANPAGSASNVSRDPATRRIVSSPAARECARRPG